MDAPLSDLIRIGHKGADAIVPGNTISSFEAAVETGVDVVEFDVLRPRGDFTGGEDWRRASGGPARASGPLLVAHDWGSAARGEPLTLGQALEAFTRPPLDAVGVDLDLKVAGREDEVAAALRDHDLLDRGMVSGMELPGLRWLAANAPDVKLGWTVPRFTRDWRRHPAAALVGPGWTVWTRRRLPALAAREAPKLGAWAVWVYHPLVTRRLVEATKSAGVAVVAWTVDELERMRDLAGMGVAGIVTNDPRLFERLS